ncbi:hypothetical protein [Oleiharenicola lentus]|uniref:hypothetical protein n=1 Tax=Oleiharenicola lentus TaxID=2508720 RepID=UPI003F67E896
MTKRRSLLPYFIVPAIPLLLPLFAMQAKVEGVGWSGSDYVIAYFLLVGAVFAYRLVTIKAAGRLSYHLGAALAVFAGLSLIWVNLAVGFIGNEDNPANLLYGGVLAVLAFSAALVRLEASGMSRALYVTAAAQFLVPLIAFLTWRPNFDVNVLMIFFLNGVWVLMFVVSALLFKLAAKTVDLAT